MLCSTPEIYNPNKSFKSNEAWMKLEPLSIQEIIKYS